jgi:hypothetical protein
MEWIFITDSSLGLFASLAAGIGAALQTSPSKFRQRFASNSSLIG